MTPTLTRLIGSSEQERIWDEVLGTRNIVVNALAGTGKTTTALEGARRYKAKDLFASVGYLAFGKDVAAEMVAKSGKSLDAVTYHSFGLRAIRTQNPKVKVDDDKVWKILDKQKLDVPDQIQRPFRTVLKKLVGTAKQFNYSTPEEIYSMAAHFGIELDVEIETDPTKEKVDWLDRATKVAPEILTKCEDMATVDFDDMPWLPCRLKLPTHKYDLLISDESQDLNPVQQYLALTSGHRLMVIGDKHQAIFGFRGADTQSIANLAAKMDNPLDLPLFTSRRCPKTHTEMARKLVPGIQSLGTNKFGSITEMSPFLANGNDLVVCRTNAPLIEAAYSLIREGIKATIRGRDVYDGMLKLLAKAEKKAKNPGLDSVMISAKKLTQDKVDWLLELPYGRGLVRAELAWDQLACLAATARGCTTVYQLTQKLDNLFSGGGGVQLGSVHKMKGMEAERVWILRSDQMPHPMAKADWEREQEFNLIYVAITRSKDEMHFCGPIPECLK